MISASRFIRLNLPAGTQTVPCLLSYRYRTLSRFHSRGDRTLSRFHSRGASFSLSYHSFFSPFLPSFRSHTSARSPPSLQNMSAADCYLYLNVAHLSMSTGLSVNSCLYGCLRAGKIFMVRYLDRASSTRSPDRPLLFSFASSSLPVEFSAPLSLLITSV